MLVSRIHLPAIALGIALTFSTMAPAQSPVPRPTADFKITPPSGKPVRIADFKGDVVVIQLLHTTCGHCQATARTFTQLQQELGARGLHFIGAAFNDEAQDKPQLIQEFIATNHVGFPIGLATRQQALSYLGLSVMTSLAVPQIVVIDRKGIIRAQSAPLGSAELQDPTRLRPLLNKLLNEAK